MRTNAPIDIGMQKKTRAITTAAIAAATMCAAVGVPAVVEGAIQYYIQGTNWAADRRAAAVAAMDAAVGRYNAHGGFNKTINVYYEPSVPTADANYNGAIRFGGTWPNERVALHEISHTLGVGQVSQWSATMTGGTWDGANALAIVRQFDGLQAVLNGDSAHFWPYGLNYDSEASAMNNARHVAMVYALRADMGLGLAANPSTATTVTLTASDAYGESSFHHSSRWSDGHFAHAGAAYVTGDYVMRTPQSGNSFTFAGDSLTLNKNQVDTGLYFKGTGATAVTTFNNLILDGGWIDHRATYNTADLFQLAGTVTVNSASTIRAKQGNIHILANITGSGEIIIPATDNPDEDNRYVRLMSSTNTFTGSLIVDGRLELADGANQKFVIGGSGVSNAIMGAGARQVLLNGVFEIDLTAASANPGDSWALVTAANTVYGDTFRVDGFTENTGRWSNGNGYVFSEATGMLTAEGSADLDGDGNVDSGDFEVFRACFRGPAVPYDESQACGRADYDVDGDVDQSDFGRLQRAYGD